MRFASRENTRLGQPEVGVGLHPGAATERLPHLVGRGRALEIVLGANDFDGDTAERYGYVNRALQTRAGRLRGRARAPDRLLRPACHRGSEGSRQPGLVAPTDRLLDAFTSFRAALDVARMPAPHRRRAGAWTAA